MSERRQLDILRPALAPKKLLQCSQRFRRIVVWLQETLLATWLFLDQDDGYEEHPTQDKNHLTGSGTVRDSVLDTE